MQSERAGIENKWFALTGRVVELKVEEDGDLHIALHDVTGDKPGVVVCEVPAQPQWCEIRTTVFSWTPTRFPFHTGTAKKLTFGQSAIITVIGKAFWDVGHAPKDQSNRRKYMSDCAVWELLYDLPLLIDRKLGIGNDVDKKNVRDRKIGVWLWVIRHKVPGSWPTRG